MTLKWTKTRPTEADVGRAFWYRDSPDHCGMTVYILKWKDTLWVRRNSCNWIVAHCPDTAEFAGPIPDPQEPEADDV